MEVKEGERYQGKINRRWIEKRVIKRRENVRVLIENVREERW